MTWVVVVISRVQLQKLPGPPGKCVPSLWDKSAGEESRWTLEPGRVQTTGGVGSSGAMATPGEVWVKQGYPQIVFPSHSHCSFGGFYNVYV